LSNDRVRFLMRWAMAIFYLVAGVLHIQSPDAFLPIMPDWVPAPREVILFTGVCEVVGALALVTRPLRWWAGLMLALYAVSQRTSNTLFITFSYRSCLRVGGTMPHGWRFSRSFYGGRCTALRSSTGHSLAASPDQATLAVIRSRKHRKSQIRLRQVGVWRQLPDCGQASPPDGPH
jgi:uncharacterized membrane protein YphA (DoxX/SURF4 family)